MAKRRKTTVLFFLLFLFTSYAQIKGVVIDSVSKKPVIYANIWVENSNIGVTANEKGEFFLPKFDKKFIIISAIGYKIKKIKLSKIHKTIQLRREIIEIPEVNVYSKKKIQELAIGSFKKSKINFYMATNDKPWIVARFFAYKTNFQKTPFLKTIKFLTKSKVDNAKFNVRLYAVDENGKPGEVIYDQNIIGFAKKGKKYTQIDLSKLNIKFPKKGFFIAVEWLIIENNKYNFSYTMEDTGKKHNDILYAPALGTIPSDSNRNSWIFIRGSWIKIWKNNTPSKKYKNKYNLLAVELKLSN